jgi:outer membrane protein assembly factor BamB
MYPRLFPCVIASIVLIANSSLPAWSADWPMARFDANRSGASPENLPANLQLQWVRSFPKLEPAWPDQAKMQFDVCYVPVVLGRTMYLGSSRHDWVTALDTVTGEERWRFFADGPVRFAPVAWEGRVFFAADDGHLYCVDANKGTLLWKFRGGPSDRKILGNDRLISTWPARGAPVVADGTVYFAASIWPFMGIFIHALDAETGKVVWTNDGDGSLYMKQPHNTDAFASVAPQGPLVVLGDMLVVAGGRSVPACFDRKTGKLLRYVLAENGRRGGSDVSGIGGFLFNGGAAFELDSEKFLGELGQPMVLTPERVFAYSAGFCRAYDVQSAGVKEVVTIDRKGKTVKTSKWSMNEVASYKTDPVESLILAGTRLYAGSKDRVRALELDEKKKSMTSTWKAGVDGTVLCLLAANERLFAVTQEGSIYCFGKDKVEPKRYGAARPAVNVSDDGWAQKARRILARTNARDGYCIAWGIGSGRLIWELARQSNLHILAVDPDAKKVQALRDKRVAADLPRIFPFHGDPATFAFPPYLASLMVAEDFESAGIQLQADFLARAFQCLRPYGGTACFVAAENVKGMAELAAKAGLANAVCKETDGLILLTRAGALPGSGNWTHEHGDAANTRVAPDKLVKAPLGVLWFGGPSHENILPRHGHGPQPQVIDGRMILEGVDLVRSIDIYTGRLLWETPLPGVGAFYNNLSHQPGANASGSNYVSTSDGIYVAYEKSCVVLDPATGAKLKEFKLPGVLKNAARPRWGYINVCGDYLIGGAEPLLDPKYLPGAPKVAPPPDKDPGPDNDKKKDPKAPTIRRPTDNMSISKHLVVMDRHTGEVLWTHTAHSGFRHNGICAGGGRLYAIDRLSGDQLGKLQRRGDKPPFPPRLVALDLQTGKEAWSTNIDVFGTMLSYSAAEDLLIECGRVAGDSLFDEAKGMRAYRGRNGKVAWQQDSYVGPAMIHGQTVLQGQKACNLLTGDLKMRIDPITGLKTPWSWIRTYGCNTPAASEHLLTFRSGAAGYFDLCNDGGTGNFGGFRSSCTNNLIVAGGLITAPEYTRTCTCSYQNQTSLALIHMPEAEMWTYFGTGELEGPIQRVGINFGGAGDRRAEDGTLWLEYPSVGGQSPAVSVTITPPDAELFRRHSSTVSGKASWITSSGLKGASEVAVGLNTGPHSRNYTVRLYFAEPDPLKAGQRIFDVEIEGKTVVTNLDVCAEAGGPRRTLIKEFKNIPALGHLTVRLTPAAGAEVRSTLLCGLEILAEGR